jgi:hypothetical protein
LEGHDLLVGLVDGPDIAGGGVLFETDHDDVIWMNLASSATIGLC